jgi:hypothetical protein
MSFLLAPASFPKQSACHRVYDTGRPQDGSGEILIAPALDTAAAVIILALASLSMVVSFVVRTAS